ncbi:MAG: hypothetical protein ACOYBW_11460 [Fluviibacter phosphoraccumulans]
MKFTNWQRFSDVDSKVISEEKGIYAFAISSTDFSNRVFHIDEEAIVYFGMTNSKGGLRSRLRQFRRALFDKGSGHGGAIRFRYKQSDASLKRLKKQLYFAVCEYKASSNNSYVDELRLMGDVARAEYVAFAKYFESYGRLPKYNEMKTSPKK